MQSQQLLLLSPTLHILHSTHSSLLSLLSFLLSPFLSCLSVHPSPQHTLSLTWRSFLLSSISRYLYFRQDSTLPVLLDASLCCSGHSSLPPICLPFPCGPLVSSSCNAYIPRDQIYGEIKINHVIRLYASLGPCVRRCVCRSACVTDV